MTQKVRAFDIDEMNPKGEICYIMEGFPFFAKTMTSRMHAFNIDETVLHAVWESFCNVW